MFASPAAAPYPDSDPVPIVVITPDGVTEVTVSSFGQQICTASVLENVARCNVSLSRGSYDFEALVSGTSLAAGGRPARGALVNGVQVVRPMKSVTIKLEVVANATAQSTEATDASVDAVKDSKLTGEVWGENLKTGTEATITAYSQPRELSKFTVGPGGTFRVGFDLPTDLEDGPHRIVVSGVGNDGEPVVGEYRFVKEGKTTAPAPPNLLAAVFGNNGDGNVGNVGPRRAAFEALPIFIATAEPQKTVSKLTDALTLVAAMAGLLAVPSALGALSGAAGSGLSGGAAGGGRSNDQKGSKRGSVGATSAKFKGRSLESSAWGDRSSTWRWPGTARLDAMSVGLPTKVHVVSPLSARTIADGDYLRAVFGALWLLLPALGLGLGVAAARQSGGSFLPPALALTAAIMALGIVDAFAGSFAAVTFILVSLALGGLPNLAQGRTLAGLVTLWFVPVLVAAKLRPLHRGPLATWEVRWDRATDLILGPLFGMWAAEGTVSGLAVLSGRVLPISASSRTFGYLAGGLIFVRYLAEELVGRLYPERLAMTDCGRPAWVGRVQQISSFLVRTIIFTVVTASFIPLVWQARAGIGFFAFGTISGWSWVTKPIPNSEKIFRLMPFGLPRTLLMLLIGKWVGSNLVNWNPDPASRVHNATIYLALPGLAFTILGMFGRDGTRMELKWWHRFVGVGVLVVFLHFKLGWFW